MSFLSSDQPPTFFSSEQWDEILFQKRMRKLEKRMNEFALSMTNEEAFKFTEWVKNRSLFCERCNIQFYSAEGMVQHRCMKC